MNRQVLGGIFIALSAFGVEAYASCGSASCPLYYHHYLKSGWFQLSYAQEYIHQSQIYVGSSKSFVGAIPHEHDEVETTNQRNTIQLQAGVIDRLGVSVEVPFIHREHSHIAHHVEDEWEYWNFTGLGDLVVKTEYIFALPTVPTDPYVSTTIGVKFATGVTDARNASGELAEVSLQPGSGSTDVIAGVHFQQSVFTVPTLAGEYSEMPLRIGVSYQLNGKGTDGWRVGNFMITSLGTEYRLTRNVSLLLQFNGKFQGYVETGSTGEPRDNTGGTWTYCSPGLSLQLSDLFAGYAYVQLPIYQNVHGIQQTAKTNIQFGITATVGMVE